MTTAFTGLHALVVDDNHASRLVAKAILERDGCKVTLAHNGLTSVEASLATQFDLILMDIQMPDISGIEAAQRIKKQSSVNAATPIVALTAYSDTQIQKTAREAGITETLTKPLRVGQLQSALNRINSKGVIPNTIEEKAIQPIAFASLENIDILNTLIISPLLDTAQPEMFDKLYQRFNHSAESFLAVINEEAQAALKNEPQSLDKIRKAAHALKGAASSVGFSRLSAQAARVQNANLSELTDLSRPLADLLAEANRELNLLISESSKSAP